MRKQFSRLVARLVPYPNSDLDFMTVWEASDLKYQDLHHMLCKISSNVFMDTKFTVIPAMRKRFLGGNGAGEKTKPHFS